MTDTQPRQRMPQGLMKGGQGQRLWRDLTERVEFDDVELRILSSACFTLDRISKMRRAMGNQLTIKGSQGQQVAHPLLKELRLDEKHFTDLISKLDIPDQFEQASAQDAQGERSSQMRAVVASRWGNAYGA